MALLGAMPFTRDLRRHRIPFPVICRDEARLTRFTPAPDLWPTPPDWRTVPTVVAHHDVKDKDHWLASPKREEIFGPVGVTNIRTFVDPQNPTHVALMMDVADMDALMAFMQTEEASGAMTHDGVLPETLTILIEA